MLLVLLQFIPLALAAITPTMVIFVTALLAQDGNAKRAFAVVFGRYLGLLVIGFAVLFILNKLPEDPVSGKLDESEALAAIFLIVGIGLMAAAGYNLVVKKVPGDKNEQSLLSRMKRLNAFVLFGACFATAFVSIRQISLLIAGTAIIQDASSRPVESLVLLLILCLAMIWPMVIPLGIKVGMGERGRRDAGAAAALDERARASHQLGGAGVFRRGPGGEGDRWPVADGWGFRRSLGRPCSRAMGTERFALADFCLTFHADS